MVGRMTILMTALVLAGVLGRYADAQETVSPPSAASILSVKGPIADSLRRAHQAGKPVEIQLGNGHSYAGKVGAVGERTVLLQELRGKEFFDALIRLGEIVAVEVRVRDR